MQQFWISKELICVCSINPYAGKNFCQALNSKRLNIQPEKQIAYQSIKSSMLLFKDEELTALSQNNKEYN